MLEKILDARGLVRLFFPIFICLIVLFVCLKFFVLHHFSAPTGPLGPFESVFANVASYTFDVLIQVLLTTLLLAACYVCFVPKEVRLKQFKPIIPSDINHELTVNLSTTNHYWFRGRSARWFRSVVIPALESNSSKKSKTVTISVLLPDPSSLVAIKNYVSYRNSISKKNDHEWTVWSVQKEIISTICKLSHLNSNNALINVNLGLLDSYSLLRYDITDVSAVLTREDTKQIAMQFVSGTHLYDTYKEEVLQGIQQGTSVNVNKDIFSDRLLDEEFVKDVMSEIGFDTISKDKFEEIVFSINNPVNPYA